MVVLEDAGLAAVLVVEVLVAGFLAVVFAVDFAEDLAALPAANFIPASLAIW